MLTAAVESDLRQELEDLRQQIRALQPPTKLRLQTRQSDCLLGQSVTVSISATDPKGQPLIDTPLTLITTWGNLRTTQELIPQQASSLTTRTDAQGQVTVVLLPPTSEDLAAAQQEALETYLTLLNAQADTPRQIQDSLTQLVNLYNWEANVAYRQAVDIYFRDFGQGLLESVNAYDYLQSWSFQNATVMALLQSGTNSGESERQAIACLTLRFKNWLAPWLETYLTTTQQDNPLGQSLGIIKQRGEAGSVVEGVYDRLQSFIETQPGMVGRYIGRKVVETSINEFLNSGMEDLEVGIKVALAPALNAASRTLQSAGVGGLAGIAQTRTELTQVVTDSVGQNTKAIASITDQLGSVTTQVGSLGNQLGGLQESDRSITASLGQLGDRLSIVQQSSASLSNQVGNLSTRLDGVQRDQGTLNGRVDGLQRDQSTIVSRLDRLQQGQTGFDRTLSNFTTRLDSIQQSVTTLDQRSTTLVTQFNTLQTNVTRIDTQMGGLQTSVGRLTEQMGGFQNRFAAIDNQIGGLQNNVGRLTDQVGGFQNRFAAIDSQIGGLQNNVGGLTDQVGGFQNRFNAIDNQLGGLQNNLGRLTDQVGGFQNRFSIIDNQLGGLQNRMGNLDTQIGRFQGNLDRFSRIATSRVVNLEDSVTRVGNNTLALRTDFHNHLEG